MATIAGPTQGTLNNGAIDPNQQSADTAQNAQNVKAHAKAFAKKEDAHLSHAIQEGRRDDASVKAELKGGSHGIAALALADGVATTGLKALAQIMQAPSAVVGAPVEVDSAQALADFSALQPLLGKPQGGATEALFEIGKGALPRVAVAGQTKLVALAHADFAEASAAPSRSSRSEKSAVVTTLAKPDPEIVARVELVKRLASLMLRTTAAQVDPATANKVAHSLGERPAGLLEPLASQMPALKEAIQKAFAALHSGAALGSSDVELPQQALSMIETAVGKAAGQAKDFVVQVKANSVQVAAVLQKHMDGDASAIARAPAAIQKLVTGVMSWNHKHGDGSFPAAQASADSATVASGAAAAPLLAQLTGAAPTKTSSEAAALGEGVFGAMDIDSLIMMVMTAGSTEQTNELQDSLKEMQNNTLAKQAARKKHEAMQAQQTAMKSAIDNEFYSLQAQGKLLPTVKMEDWENFRQIRFGDGQTNADGTFTGPNAQLPPLPDPLPTVFTQQSAPAGAVGDIASATTYGLTAAQYNFLQEQYDTLPKPKPDTLAAWLTLPGPPPAGVGLKPITKVQDAIDNVKAAAGVPAALAADAKQQAAAAVPVNADVAIPATMYEDYQSDTKTPEALLLDLNSMLNPQPPTAQSKALVAQLAFLGCDAGSAATHIMALIVGLAKGQLLTNNSNVRSTDNDDQMNTQIDNLNQVLTAATKALGADQGAALQTMVMGAEHQVFKQFSDASKSLADLYGSNGNAAGNVGNDQLLASTDTYIATLNATAIPAGANEQQPGGPAVGKMTPGKANASDKYGSNAIDHPDQVGDGIGKGGAWAAALTVLPFFPPGAAVMAILELTGNWSTLFDGHADDNARSFSAISDTLDKWSHSGPQVTGGITEGQSVKVSDLRNAVRQASANQLTNAETKSASPQSAALSVLAAAYNAAFGTADAKAQAAFIAGLPGSLPKNARGEFYDPGTDKSRDPNALTPAEALIVKQLVSAGAFPLGKTPTQLTAEAKSEGDATAYAAYLDSIGASQATALNETGSLAAMGNAVSAAQDQIDSLGDVSTSLQMRIQLQQGHYSQIMEALSNIMKKMGDVHQAIVENMK